MNILMTGTAGTIGSILVNGLRNRYRIRGFDRKPMPGLDDAIVGELTDLESVLKAAEGMDVIVHLA